MAEDQQLSASVLPGTNTDAGGARLAVASRQRGWLARSLSDGLLATGAVTGLVLLADGWSTVVRGAPLFSGTSGELGLAVLFHLSAGLIWAGLYAVYVEPTITGPGWRRGMAFSLLLWVTSLTVLLPASQAAGIGLSLTTGVLAALASLALNLTYGAILGQSYGNGRFLGEGGEPASAAEALADARMPGWMILGSAIGALAGLVVGGAGAGLVAPGLAAAPVLALAVALGALSGLLAGSFVALTPRRS
jgi:hypothetical protein